LGALSQPSDGLAGCAQLFADAKVAFVPPGGSSFELLTDGLALLSVSTLRERRCRLNTTGDHQGLKWLLCTTRQDGLWLVWPWLQRLLKAGIHRLPSPIASQQRH